MNLQQFRRAARNFESSCTSVCSNTTEDLVDLLSENRDCMSDVETIIQRGLEVVEYFKEVRKQISTARRRELPAPVPAATPTRTTAEEPEDDPPPSARNDIIRTRSTLRSKAPMAPPTITKTTTSGVTRSTTAAVAAPSPVLQRLRSRSSEPPTLPEEPPIEEEEDSPRLIVRRNTLKRKQILPEPVATVPREAKRPKRSSILPPQLQIIRTRPEFVSELQAVDEL